MSINGVQASVVTASQTQLTVTVPQGATTGAFTITVNSRTATSPVLTIVAAPLSTWEEITAPSPIGDAVISAAVGDAVIYTNITFDTPLVANNLYKISNSTVSSIYGSTPYAIGTVYSLSNSSNMVYVKSSQGIFTSEDGSTWQALTPAFGSGQPYTGLVTKGNQLIVYNGTKAFTSTDKGVTWTSQNFVNPGSYIVGDGAIYSGEAANNYYYSIPFMGAGGVAITRSNDGINWTTSKAKLSGYYYAFGYRDALAAAGDNVFCISSEFLSSATDSKRLYQSTDHGDSWTVVNDEKINTVKAFGNYVIYGYDSINMSTDNGNTFKKYAIPTGYIIGGLQKAGNYLYIFCTSGTKRKIFRSSL